MTQQNNRQIVKTTKGKADLVVGIISLIFGIFITKGALTYTMWSFAYDDTAANLAKFGIFILIVGIVCLIHYGAKAPKVIYSDGTTGTLKAGKQ